MAGGSWTLYFMWMVMVTNQNWASFIFISVSANTKIFYILYLSLSQQTQNILHLSLSQQTQYNLFKKVHLHLVYFLKLAKREPIILLHPTFLEISRCQQMPNEMLVVRWLLDTYKQFLGETNREISSSCHDWLLPLNEGRHQHAVILGN